jgi:hypothetical protein
MKKILFITDAKGGPGKTLIAHHCLRALTRLHYPPIFGERTPQRFPRLKAKRRSRSPPTRFVIENRVAGEIDPKMLSKIAAGATVACLMNQVMDEQAALILQAGGLASIAKLDAKALHAKFGIAQGSRIRRDLTRVRLDVMHSVRLVAEWLVA